MGFGDAWMLWFTVAGGIGVDENGEMRLRSGWRVRWQSFYGGFFCGFLCVSDELRAKIMEENEGDGVRP